MEPSPPGWFGRNWKWFVPVGCVTLLLLVVIAAAAIGYGLLGLYENSGMADPKRDALAAAQASPAVKQALGEPMQLGFMMSGQININNDRGHADVSFPIHGPRGKGRVHVVGEMTGDRWTYSVLEAQIDGQPAPVDLRREPPPWPPGP
jgi:hypothetical protein